MGQNTGMSFGGGKRDVKINQALKSLLKKENLREEEQKN